MWYCNCLVVVLIGHYCSCIVVSHMFCHFNSNWKLKDIVIIVPMSCGNCLMVVSMTIVGSSSYYDVVNVTLSQHLWI
jgi:hypothetical protein